jgi:hypothetical protein
LSIRLSAICSIYKVAFILTIDREVILARAAQFTLTTAGGVQDPNPRLLSGGPTASSVPFRCGHDRQPFLPRRLSEAIVKCHERQRLAHLALEIEATGQLHRVTGPQAVAEQEGARRCRNLWSDLDHDQRGYIVGECRERPVAFRDRKRPFARPAHQGGGDLDL